MRRNTTRRTLCFLLLAGALHAGDAAWDGYDPVAYFTRGKATPGQSGITLMFGGQTIRFSTTAHRDMFRQAPEKYAPQFDGQCAYAMSQHARMPANPRAFAIIGGRLFLFSKPELVAQFQQKAERLLAEAEAYWASLQVRDNRKVKP